MGGKTLFYDQYYILQGRYVFGSMHVRAYYSVCKHNCMKSFGLILMKISRGVDSSGCSSGGRAGHLLIGRFMVKTLAAPVSIPKYGDWSSSSVSWEDTES